MYQHLDKRITKTVMEIVESLCADYPRRRRLADYLSYTNGNEAKIDQIRSINANIDEGLKEVDEGLREYMLSDIANRNGYGRSMASPFIRKDSYYAQKNKAILKIAQLFDLVV